MTEPGSLEHQVAMDNQILASLTEEDFEDLRPHLEWVETSLGQVLYEVGQPISHVYFPLRALMSRVGGAKETENVEFGLVGNEGFVGIPALLGGESTLSRAVVQVPGEAIRIEGAILKAAFDRGGALQKQLLIYIQFALTEASQNVTCQTFHQIEPRFARWLLAFQDKLQSHEFSLTHKYAATLLGTRRASITEAAGSLQQSGMIEYRRGQITIRDRMALEQAACECYSTLRQEQERLQAISRRIS